MKELDEILATIEKDGLIRAVCSNPVPAAEEKKADIRLIRLQGEMKWQLSVYRGQQVFHRNLEQNQLKEELKKLVGVVFRQTQVETVHTTGTLLVGKRGTVTWKPKRKPEQSDSLQEKALSHDRKKQYLLPEGKPVDFLVRLGVMNPEGKVLKQRYDKFRQINRFLEYIEDVLTVLPKDRPLRIVDFGCGKSYLTFALYYYLHEQKGRKLWVVGLDLKKDVIEHCNALAKELHYEELHFELGDIAGYRNEEGADMVVTLHACDTATDYALAQAVQWNASVILSVPCCQHEVNRQIHCSRLEPMLRYGIIKERLSALVTDSLRAELLRARGYDTQILEFVDMDHTPKNLMIRAVKGKNMKPAGRTGEGVSENIEQFAQFLQVDTTLQKLLRESEKE